MPAIVTTGSARSDDRTPREEGASARRLHPSSASIRNTQGERRARQAPRARPVRRGLRDRNPRCDALVSSPRLHRFVSRGRRNAVSPTGRARCQFHCRRIRVWFDSVTKRATRASSRQKLRPRCSAARDSRPRRLPNVCDRGIRQTRSRALASLVEQVGPEYGQQALAWA